MTLGYPKNDMVLGVERSEVKIKVKVTVRIFHTYLLTSHSSHFCSHNSCHIMSAAMLKHVLAIGWTSVCPSVRPSVTRWYCIKTAEHRHVSSPHDSPFILVLCVSRSSRNSDGVTPCAGPLNRGWVWKCRNFRPITCYISETVEDKWIAYIQRGVLQALNPLSNRVTFTAIGPGAYPGEAKMCKNMC